MLIQATYIWPDGATPQSLRSKMRVILAEPSNLHLKDFPRWGFDGSSTYQAKGNFSDLVLQPVCFVPVPTFGSDHFLVLCEVLNNDLTPHISNKRAPLQALMQHIEKEEPWIGFEQEYTLFSGLQPLGWPDRGYPAPQGPFYCGVGADEAFGREMVDEHANACLKAGLMLYGTNAEVMPGQWEFQIGYRGISTETPDPLTVSDHLWLARWLLYRIGEHYNISAKLHPKPVKGDWNGAGKHTNFSTKAMRDPQTGAQTIKKAITALQKNHQKHLRVYGTHIEERLTGQHETASYMEFRSGAGDRGASVRIPLSVAEDGYGYLEDRRPCANANPYEVSAALLETICFDVDATAS